MPEHLHQSATPQPDHENDRWADIDTQTPAIREDQARNPDAPIPKFGDSSWSIDALGVRSGGNKVTLYFEPSPGARSDIAYPPARYADTLRHVAYLLVNEAVPPEDRERRHSSAVERMAPGTIRNFLKSCSVFMEWLAQRQVDCLSDCTPALLDLYFGDVVRRETIASTTKFTRLSPVERLAFMAPSLPAMDRLCQPNWKASDALGVGRTAASGSSREVLDPETADPLLSFVVLCARVVAPDILAAHDRARFLATQPATPEPFTRARTVLRDLAESGGIPAERMPGGRLRLEATGLGLVHGITNKNLSTALRREELQEHLNGDRPVLMDSPIHGVVGDRLWCDGVPWKGLEGDFPSLLRHVQAACWVVLAFLSGARPDEVRALPIDPLVVVPPRTPGGAVRYFLKGPTSKGVRGTDGRVSLEGRDDRWVTVGPAVDAVRVASDIARRLFDDPQYLFPGDAATESVRHDTMAQRVRKMVDWANALMLEQQWPEAHRIPHEKDGYWDLSGFRRTTAWHIHKEPQGEVALALQFKHVTTSLGDGYASAADIGVRRVMNRATREAHDALMSEVADALVQGTHVSGPAAERLVEIAQVEHPLQANFVTEREARRIADDGRRVFDNPGAYSLCVFDPSRAKCLTPATDGSPTDVPDRGSCQLDCTCHARTDTQIDRLREEAAQHRRESQSPLTPEPLAVRLAQVAERKSKQVEQHERTAVFISLTDLRVRNEHEEDS